MICRITIERVGVARVIRAYVVRVYDENGNEIKAFNVYSTITPQTAIDSAARRCRDHVLADNVVVKYLGADNEKSVGE